ncbi:MAG: DUF4035 domain-containing protein [Gemmatales bacterium]|nr:DUF4035 domain-containing protein [Gemmatales bacterium]MDW8174672.1 DUF4035 domain-containing protein [Gemmatales bacterium]
MPWSELSTWLAYYSLEPWGEDRADLRAAIVASVIANANRSSDTPPFELWQFMPDFAGDYENLSRESSMTEDQFLSLMAAMGAKVINHNDKG